LDEEGESAPVREPITKADLFAWGLSGGDGSAEKRKELLKRLELPEHLNANGLLEALNLLYGREDLEALLENKE
jgi:ribonuclease M5